MKISAFKERTSISSDQKKNNGAKTLPAVPVHQAKAEDNEQIQHAGQNENVTLGNQPSLKSFQLKGNHDKGCNCVGCQPAMAPIQAKMAFNTNNSVVQRARFFSQSQVNNFDTIIQNLISEMDDARLGGTHEYDTLERILNSYESNSNAEAVLREIAGITSSTATPYLNRLKATVHDMLLTNSRSIRATNYPSSYTTTAINARDTYRNGRVNATTHPGQWYCPGTGGGAHWRDYSDITIDHRTSVAQHWNTTGYNCSQTNRNTWYSDTTNHDYMCRSCNSSLGSGGHTYRLDKGPNFSNM